MERRTGQRDPPRLGATGDACSIDLPDGLEEPGTRDANGNCRSVLHPGKCQDGKRTITTKLTLIAY